MPGPAPAPRPGRGRGRCLQRSRPTRWRPRPGRMRRPRPGAALGPVRRPATPVAEASKRTVPSRGAFTRRCFQSSPSEASALARKRVPTYAPAAPNSSTAARPRPSVMPPAATTGSGDSASTIWGTRTEPPMRPPKPPAPPASDPWAMMMSAPSSAARRACSTVWTWVMTSAPPSWMRETRSPGRPCATEMARGSAASAQSRQSGWSCSHALVKFTMNGRDVSSRTASSSARRSSCDRLAAPIVPIAPALETAAARTAPLPNLPIPAWMMGCSIPSRPRSGVRSTNRPPRGMQAFRMVTAGARPDNPGGQGRGRAPMGPLMPCPLLGRDRPPRTLTAVQPPGQSMGTRRRCWACSMRSTSTP